MNAFLHSNENSVELHGLMRITLDFSKGKLQGQAFTNPSNPTTSSYGGQMQTQSRLASNLAVRINNYHPGVNREAATDLNQACPAKESRGAHRNAGDRTLLLVCRTSSPGLKVTKHLCSALPGDGGAHGTLGPNSCGPV